MVDLMRDDRRNSFFGGISLANRPPTHAYQKVFYTSSTSSHSPIPNHPDKLPRSPLKIHRIIMSSADRPGVVRMAEAAVFFSLAGVQLALFLATPASEHLFSVRVNIVLFAAAIPLGTLISLTVALAISAIIEPYSRYAPRLAELDGLLGGQLLVAVIRSRVESTTPDGLLAEIWRLGGAVYHLVLPSIVEMLGTLAI